MPLTLQTEQSLKEDITSALKHFQSKLDTGNAVQICIWAGKFGPWGEKEHFTKELKYWFALKNYLVHHHVSNNSKWEVFMKRPLETGRSHILESSVGRRWWTFWSGYWMQPSHWTLLWACSSLTWIFFTLKCLNFCFPKLQAAVSSATCCVTMISFCLL